MADAFQHIKEVDCFVLKTDASSRGITAALNVVKDGEELTMAYFSRQLHGAQKCYSTTELECLAVVIAVEHFGHYL